MSDLDPELLETAALIAQEIGDDWSLVGSSRGRLGRFVERWRREYPDKPDFLEITPYYRAFFGWDQRVSPTHDMNTGEPLRRFR